MDNEQLQHWGIKGMKWGVRRFQNKNGSLTPEGKKRYADDNDGESVEAKRERLLKSTDANEIYKNRSLLTTNEINERLNRINTEQRLAEVAASTKKSGYDRINSLLKAGNKMNEIYQFTQTPVMRALMKKLSPQAADALDNLDLDGVLKNANKLTNQQLKDYNLRFTNLKSLNKLKKELYGDDDTIQTKTEKKEEETGKSEKVETSTPAKASTETKPDTTTSSKSEKPFTPSNSNAKSVHELYKEYAAGQQTVDDLYKSGYAMKSISSLTGDGPSSHVTNGKAFLSTVGGFRMRSLEELEKYM